MSIFQKIRPSTWRDAKSLAQFSTGSSARSGGSLAEAFVSRASDALAGGTSRRSFLTRTAVVGSAIAINPFSYLVKAASAAEVVCDSAGTSGWTAFCCTINSGKNSCPPNSFVAGWWKADGSLYCNNGPRYIVDCNATCPTRCSCHHAGGGCDNRRVCCNQFRYGQCNQQISCYGPVVCRVAICITPWAYDAACGTRNLVDNKTSNHGAACLSKNELNTAITRRYYALGGPDGFLGKTTSSERLTGDNKGYYAIYNGGRIYYRSGIGAFEVHGSILDYWRNHGGTGTPYEFPTSGQKDGGNGLRYNTFQGGAIYRLNGGQTYGVPQPFYNVYKFFGGHSSSGTLGLPGSDIATSSDGQARVIYFERGRIYERGGIAYEIHGALSDRLAALGGVPNALGHLISHVQVTADGRGRWSEFTNGAIFWSQATGAKALRQPMYGAYIAGGGSITLGLPTAESTAVGDGRGQIVLTEKGRIYSTSTSGTYAVAPPILSVYLGADGPTGAYGYPTGTVTADDSGYLTQPFEGGDITVLSLNAAFVKAAYADFLDRPPTGSELRTWVTNLEKGVKKRGQLTEQLGNSDEYISTLVQRFYQQTLGREGTAEDVGWWAGEIRSDRWTVAKAASFFYASNEYFNGIGGGTNRTWIIDLYEKLLGRTADNEDIDWWIDETVRRGRGDVAFRFFQTIESRLSRVMSLYDQFLDRTASDVDARWWADQIATRGDVRLAITIASLQEYFDRAQARFPG